MTIKNNVIRPTIGKSPAYGRTEENKPGRGRLNKIKP